MASIKKIEGKKGISFQLIAYMGYDSQGKKLTKTKTWRPSFEIKTDRQLDKAIKLATIEAAKFEDAVNSGQLADGKLTFADFSRRWLQANEIRFAPITYTRYETLLVRINQAIGHKRICKISPMDLEEFYASLAKVKSEATGKLLSQQTIKHYHQCISVILADAVKKQIIPFNPASRERINAPVVAKKEPAHFDDEQAKRFIEALQRETDLRKVAAFTLLIYSGIRLGELNGLEWQDIDFDKQTIAIRRTSQAVKGKGIITKVPKNRTSTRTIKLPAIVFDILHAYQNWYYDQKQAVGSNWIESNRLLTQSDGRPITPTLPNKWLDTILETHRLPRVTPHGLRHTNISLLIANGVDLRTVANKAGHSRTSTTSDIYAHVIQAADEQASEVLDSVLTPRIKKA